MYHDGILPDIPNGMSQKTFRDQVRKWMRMEDVQGLRDKGYKLKYFFEEHGGTCTLGADGIYYPNRILEEVAPTYGKYGMLRKRLFCRN